MSTDRELLEAAAKAAGMEGDISTTIGGWPCLILGNGHAWQPLHDDADALRLAVRLNMALTVSEHRETHCEGPIDLDAYAYEKHGYDPYAATRRAIVRAAAAIGGAA